MSTRGEWAGVLPENYYERVRDASGGVHAHESASSRANRQPEMSHAYDRPAVSRRQDVIDAAVALLRESGPAALTSINVAARLGITQPAIYRHIRDMDELTTLASRAVVADLSVAMMAVLEAPEGQWGDGTNFAQFANRIVDLIATQAYSFEVLDRWRFDGGELGIGIRSLLDLARDALAEVLEVQLRDNFGYDEPFDDAAITAQLTHAQLIVDDVIITTRLIRESTSADLNASAARLLSLRIFAGWYAYVHDLIRRCGLPTPTLDDDTLRVPVLAPW